MQSTIRRVLTHDAEGTTIRSILNELESFKKGNPDLEPFLEIEENFKTGETTIYIAWHIEVRR